MIVLKGKVWKICKFKGGGLARIRGIGVFEGGGGGGVGHTPMHTMYYRMPLTQKEISMFKYFIGPKKYYKNHH